MINEKIELARNPNTSIEVLEQLSKDEYFRVRIEVAINNNTPSNVLVELSNDKDYRVRIEVAINTNTPIEVLEFLTNDKDYRVREISSENLERIKNDIDNDFYLDSYNKKIN